MIHCKILKTWWWKFTCQKEKSLVLSKRSYFVGNVGPFLLGPFCIQFNTSKRWALSGVIPRNLVSCSLNLVQLGYKNRHISLWYVYLHACVYNVLIFIIIDYLHCQHGLVIPNSKRWKWHRCNHDSCWIPFWNIFCVLKQLHCVSIKAERHILADGLLKKAMISHCGGWTDVVSSAKQHGGLN